MCCCKVGSVRSGVIWRSRWGKARLSPLWSGLAVWVSYVRVSFGRVRQGGLGLFRYGRIWLGMVGRSGCVKLW